jgi:hypothetical protein
MSVEQSVECVARETEVLGGNLLPVPLCPPQIPHDHTWARTRATAVGSRLQNRLSYSTALIRALLDVLCPLMWDTVLVNTERVNVWKDTIVVFFERIVMQFN